MKEKAAAARRSQQEAEKLAESRARRRQARDAKLRKQEDYAAQPQMPPPAPQHTRSATEQCQRRYRQARRWYRRHGHTVGRPQAVAGPEGNTDLRRSLLKGLRLDHAVERIKITHHA